MKFRNILCLALSLVMIFSLTACGGKAVTSTILEGTDESEISSLDETTTSATPDASSKNEESSTEKTSSSKKEDISSKKPDKNSSKEENEENNEESSEPVDTSATFTIVENKSKFATLGKAVIDDTGCKLSGTVDCLTFRADCSGDVLMSYTTTSLTTSDGYGIYLTVYIDGTRQNQRYHINNSSGTISIASGLLPGTHNFKIYRQTEYKGDLKNASNIMHINSITLDNGGELKSPTKNSFTIEFIGDSITAGYGSYSKTNYAPQDGEAPCYQDGTNTYAFLTAEALNADISVTAFSGCGIVKGFEFFTMPEVYKHYPNMATKKQFEYPDEPEIVVINLGTNDGWNGVAVDKFVEGAVDFGKTVRAIHPDAKIVFIGGMMATGWNQEFAKIASKLGGSSKGFYSWFEKTACPGHPTAEEHKEIAGRFTEYLKTIID